MFTYHFVEECLVPIFVLLISLPEIDSQIQYISRQQNSRFNLQNQMIFENGTRTTILGTVFLDTQRMIDQKRFALTRIPVT